MLFKKILLTKLIIQIGIMISITNTEKSEKNIASENWHKTQVFIFYNKEHSNKQIVDCLGTILSPRFILTTATYKTMEFSMFKLVLDQVLIKKFQGYLRTKNVQEKRLSVSKFRNFSCQFSHFGRIFFST